MLFRPSKTVAPFYLGGPVACTADTVISAAANEVIVVDLVNSLEKARIDVDGEQITAISIAPNGSLFFVATRSLRISFYDLTTFERVNVIPKAHESAVLAMAVDSTSTLLATGGAEGAVKVWDIAGGFTTHNLKGHGGLVTTLRFYGELGGTDWRLLSGSDDTNVRVWDLARSKCISVLEEHANVVRAIDISRNGDIIMSSGRDKVVCLYRDYQLIATLPVHKETEAAGFIAGKYIYTGSAGGVSLWNLQGGLLTKWENPIGDSELIDLVRVNEDVLKLCAVLSDQTLVYLQINPDQETNLLEVTKTIAGNHGEIIDLRTFSPKTGELSIAMSTNSPDVRLVDAATPYEFSILSGHEDIVLSLDVLGRWLATAGKDKEIRLWDMQSAECKEVFKGHTGSVGAVALSRGGSVPQFLLSGAQDLTVKRWSADGTADYTRKAHEKEINFIAVSPDNKLFASASQDKTVKIWHTETGDVKGVLKGHRRGVWCVEFGPQNTIATCSGDKTIKIWNLHDYTCQQTLEGHISSVLKLTYLNDDCIVSAGADGLVKVWDIKSGECLATLDNHEDKVWSLARTSTPGQLVSGGGDGILTIWQDCSSEEEARIQEEDAHQVELQQELENVIRNQDWERAITLALELDQPFRLLKLLTTVQNQREPGSVSGLCSVDEVIANLSSKKLVKLLERIRNWNTNGRTSAVAQTVLHTVLKKRPMKDLQNPHTMKIITAIQPYTQKHLARYRELEENSYTLDYVLEQMGL